MRYAIVVAIALALVGALASPAHAHVRTGIRAGDYRATLETRSLDGLRVEILPTDLALRVRGRPDQAVVVLGYIGEPFIRLDDSGSWINEHSPTAATVGLLRPSVSTAGSRRGWRLHSTGAEIVWHDARLQGTGSGERRRWNVPVVIDGRKVALEGEVRRISPPSLWPWVALAAPLVLGLYFLLRDRRPRRIARIAVISGAVAGAATIASAGAFALSPSAGASVWVVGANEASFALVCVAILLLGSAQARVVAAGIVGLLALFAGLAQVPVFMHGVVFAAVPASLVRLIAASAICAGALATATSVFFLDPRYARSLGRERRLRAARAT